MPNLFSITATLAIIVFTSVLQVSKVAYMYNSLELMCIVLIYDELSQNYSLVCRKTSHPVTFTIIVHRGRVTGNLRPNCGRDRGPRRPHHVVTAEEQILSKNIPV